MMKIEYKPSEITNIDFDKMVYTLLSLNDITEEIISTFDIKITSAKILRIIMGTLGVTKGIIMLHISSRAAFEVIANKGFDERPYIKGFEEKIYLKVSAKEITDKFSGLSTLFFEEFQKDCPDFIEKNSYLFESENFQIYHPLFIRNKFIGAIILGEKLNRTTFLETELFLLTMIGRQVAIALYNFQLIEDLKKEKEKYLKRTMELGDVDYRVQTLRQISMDLSKILDVQKFLDSFIEGAVNHLSASNGLICKTEEIIEGEAEKIENPLMVEVMAIKKIYHLPKGTRIHCKWDDPFGITIQKGEPVIMELKDEWMGIKAKYVIAVPLKVKDPWKKEKIIGVLAIFDKESKEKDKFTSFDERDEALLGSLANQGAILWENARLYEDATLDGLTRLYVRRFWERRLYEEVKKALRYQKNLSLMMIDIDHFKRFNDTYGHQTGDEVLKAVSAQISQKMRKDIDIPARYGGEELSVIMPETDLKGGMNMAERLREAVYNTQLPNPNPVQRPLSVTISIGVSSLPLLNLDEKSKLQMTHQAWHELVLSYKQNLLEQADLSLYESKNKGRNRVTAYSESLEKM